jgi:hypothetical protein
MLGGKPTARARWLALQAGVLTALTGRHRYLSTGCLHGDHLYCNAMTGMAGAKRPGRCKGCDDGRCICPCHRDAFAAPDASTRQEG